ncbi:3-dehydroquinate synthase [Acholeplasma hippikon]|nr:3-dehydroquinate synthase [Acholeplasma hippikon]
MNLKVDNYEIIIKENLFFDFDNQIKKVYTGDKLFIVTDDNLFKVYEEKLKNALHSFKLEFVVIPSGENSKSMKIYEKVVSELIRKHIRRNQMIVAFGGGVVGDLAGFVAGTVLRGVPFIQIPTSLLAMVDSSIGGKVGIDLPEGKNLVGLFNNPKVVLIDPNLLQTLPVDEYRNGLAEVIKAGIIGDYSILEYLKKHDKLTINEIIKSIEVKRKIVLKDPFEKNERMYLNFGHTFGHAIERHFDYAIKHGIAVAYGMLIALDEGVKRGITKKELYEEIKALLLRLKLVKEPLLVMKDFVSYIASDKKQLSDGLRFVFMSDYEKPEIHKGVIFDA